MKRKPRRKLLYILAKIVSVPLYLIPLRMGVVLGGFFGKVAYYVLRGERRKTLSHLRLAFSAEKTEKEIRSIAKRLFSNLGKNALEWVNSGKIDRKWLISRIRPLGRENIDKAHERGKGVIFLISHFGNWELMGFYLAQTGYAGPSIAKRFYIEEFNQLLVKMRTDKGVGVIYSDESPKEILRVLKGNGYIGILGDQDVRIAEGVFVDFFGKPAYTPSAPVKIASKTGALMIPVFLVREKGYRFKFIAEKAIELVSSSDSEKDTIINTARWTKLLESYIRKYPDHWVWMHRRWKTKPDDLQKN